jgi:hypothetical protein
MPLMESAHRGNKNDWTWQSVVELPHPGKGSHDSHIFRIVDGGLEGNTGASSIVLVIVLVLVLES